VIVGVRCDAALHLRVPVRYMQIGQDRVDECFKRLFRDYPPIEKNRGESPMRCTDPQDTPRHLGVFRQKLGFGRFC